MDRRSFTKSLMGAVLAPAASLRGLTPSAGRASFDVRRFGAIGDGRADDTDAFKSAIAAASSVAGTVTAGAGTFRVVRALKLPSGVSLCGVGAASVLLHIGGDPEVITAVDAKGVAVQDLSIRGEFSHGVLIHHSTEASVLRCSISGGTRPRYGYSGGVMIVGSAAIRVEGCRMRDNGGDAYIQGSDIQCDGLGDTSRDIHILRNDCGSTRAAVNIRCYDTSRSEIRGNVVRGARILGAQNHGYGILVYPTAPNQNACFENVIIGNTVSNTQGSGIYLVRSARSRIEDNTISNVASIQADVTLPVGGVALNQSENTTVLRNRITGSGRAGISVASNRSGIGHVQVRDNILTTIGGYAIHLRGILEDIQVTGNTISDADGGIGGDTADTQDGIEVSRNSVSGIRGSGIKLPNARRSTVTGNVVSNCTGYGIDVALHDAESAAEGNDVKDCGKTWGPGAPMVRVTRGERKPQ